MGSSLSLCHPDFAILRLRLRDFAFGTSPSREHLRDLEFTISPSRCRLCDFDFATSFSRKQFVGDIRVCYGLVWFPGLMVVSQIAGLFGFNQYWALQGSGFSWVKPQFWPCVGLGFSLAKAELMPCKGVGFSLGKPKGVRFSLFKPELGLRDFATSASRFRHRDFAFAKSLSRFGLHNVAFAMSLSRWCFRVLAWPCLVLRLNDAKPDFGFSLVKPELGASGFRL